MTDGFNSAYADGRSDSSAEHALNKQIVFREKNMVLLMDDVPLSGEIYAFKRSGFEEAVALFCFHGNLGEDGNAHVFDDALLDGFSVEHVLHAAQLYVIGIQA